jgi:hypothetical protein
MSDKENPMTAQAIPADADTLPDVGFTAIEIGYWDWLTHTAHKFPIGTPFIIHARMSDDTIIVRFTNGQCFRLTSSEWEAI